MSKRVHYIVLVIVLALVLSEASAQARMDTIKVTVELNNESLLELFKKIESQSGLYFAYRLENIQDVTGLTLPKDKRTIKQTLDLVFKNTGFTYRQVDNSILITGKKNVSAADALPANAGTSVSGTVTDKNGDPLPGVSIFIKGTSTGTTSDANGNYSIEAKPDDVLVFSFIGQKTKEAIVYGLTTMDIVMEEDINTLQEVTINGGYYETTNKLKTGNITKVTAKEIENQPVASPLMALQGRVPGLDITPNNGTPGNAPKIRIRGTNSLRVFGKSGSGTFSAEADGNYPLYVIDGVPISSAPITGFSATNSFSQGGYDPISAIGLSNIESIEILKDGDATAIYGSRGANGVILITTKRKVKGNDRTSFNFSTYAGIGQINQRMDLLNTKEYVMMRNEAIANDNLTPAVYDYDLVKWDTTRYTDWQKELLNGKSHITDVQGAISFGNNNTTFNLGLSYHKETLIFSRDFGYNRGSGNFSVNHTSKDQKFSVSVSTNYGVDVSELFNGDFVVAALTLAPNAPKLYDQNGELNWELTDVGGGVMGSTWINPMSYMLQTQRTVGKNFVASSNLSYALLPGIVIATNIGYTDFTSNEKFASPISSRQPTYDNTGKLINATGFANFANTRRTSWIIEPKISITKKWNIHSFNAVIGSTWQESISSSLSQSGERYLSDALLGSLKGAGNVVINSDNFSEYRYVSLYGRLGYILNQKYILNLTARRDGSSRFGPGNRFADFWSIGTGWIFSNEHPVKNNVSFLTFGKLRASYGVTGSDNIGDYQYYNLYKTVPNQYLGVTGVVPSALNNPNYAWELTKKVEVGLELAFLENRLSVEISGYRNRSSNQLINYPLSAITGFDYVLKNFEATIQNSGWEIVVGSDLSSSSDWRWNASINVSIPQNKLIRFENIENSPYATIYKVGEPLSIQYLFVNRGVDPQTGQYKFDDLNNDGFIRESDDRKFVNAMDKAVYGGLNNVIQYKNFELSFLFQFTKQNSFRNLSPYTPGYKFYNQPAYVLDRWKQEGDIAAIQRFGTTAGVNSPIETFDHMINSTHNITDASFIRLKTISLSYQLTGSLLERIKLQQAKVFLQGQNIFTITSYKGLDPETKTALPPLQMLTAGIQLKI